MDQTFRRSALTLVRCLSIGICTLLISPALAQVNGPGPSPSSDFDIVLNLPGDEAVITGGYNESIGGVAGQTTQLNVSDGGNVGFSFEANSGSEVNISGGSVLSEFTASGSEVNISGGNLGRSLILDASQLNITGGTAGSFEARSGSVVNISGGTVGFLPAALVFSGTASDSVVNVSGGNLIGILDASSGSEVNISGATLVEVNAAYDSVVNFSGGSARTLRAIADGVVNISGGNVDVLSVFSDGVVNISGGSVGNQITANEGSALNIRGTEFSINGTPLSNLQNEQPFIVNDRDGTLSGVLADGEPFSFTFGASYRSISPNATLTVTLVEPIFLLGDCNQNGVVDFSDIPAFISVLIADTFLAEADTNQDGMVDFADIPPFIDILILLAN